MTVAYRAEYAYLPGGVASDVRIEIDGERIAAVAAGAPATSPELRLAGVTYPGFANTHSHAFHRALRGRTHDGGGTFWTWRELMYAVADRLDPDTYLALARAVFAEMALAGVSCVGEFHYLHHREGGRPYDDPNAMGHALLQAAHEAGIRITLLDACYLAGGLDAAGPRPLEGVQLRFGDADVDAWAARVSGLRAQPHAVVGAAVHSVRAVPRDAIPAIVAAAAGRPLHVHLSEQTAENEQCRAAHGMSPTALLAEAGALGAATTAVHATHVDADDIARLAASSTAIGMCPTTERDLGDGIGPARALSDAGCAITLGSDQNAVVDLLEEARALEMDERLAARERGRFTPHQLVAALTADGHRALGWPDAGRLEAGARADLTTVRLDSPRTAGATPAQLVLAASAADVTSVIVDGRTVVADGQHRLGDVGRLLVEAVARLM